MAKRKQYVKPDRFGRPTQSILCNDKKSKGYFKGLVNLAGKDYMIEFNPSNVECSGKGDYCVCFVQVTKLEEKRRNLSM